MICPTEKLRLTVFPALNHMSCMGQENLSNFWNEWGSILGESLLQIVEIDDEEELKKQ